MRAVIHQSLTSTAPHSICFISIIVSLRVMKCFWHSPCYINKKHKIQFFRTHSIKEAKTILLVLQTIFFFLQSTVVFSSYFSFLASVLLLLHFALLPHSDISIIFNTTFYWNHFFLLMLSFLTRSHSDGISYGRSHWFVYLFTQRRLITS